MSKSQYYPETKMDSISAQNQPYPSSKYYPYPEPKNTFRLNPLVISSLKNIDIDDLQMAFGKGIQQKREFQRGRSIENAKLLNENSEIKEIKDSIEQAKLNQFRAHQIHENQIRRVQNLMKDTEADEQVLKKLEYEKRKAAEEEERKKQDRIRAKHLIQQQMKDKEFLKEEAKKEYEKDKIDVNNMINKLKEEDLAAQAEAERKKNIQKLYMESAYAEKDARKERQKEEDRLQKERERKYHEDVQKREDELNSKKAAIQFEKDKIFEQLCQQEAQRQAEEEAMAMIKQLLSYIPQNNLEKTPRVTCTDPIDRMEDYLNDIIPDNPNMPYDMYQVIAGIVDNGEFFEVQPNFAKNIIIGFARFNGQSVGIVANQPKQLAGVLDCNSSRKGARFVRFCDAFNIPIVTLVDVPGFLPGTGQEYNAVILHGAKLLYAYGEATIPKVTVTLRKSYGGSHIVMSCKQLRGDLNYAWPSSEIAVMGASGAASVLYAKEAKALKDEGKVEESKAYMAEKQKEYEDLFANPYQAAKYGYIDDVIEPRNTRFRIIRALAQLENKKLTNPAKKHGNIPL